MLTISFIRQWRCYGTIYTPYVEALEHEFEYRTVYYNGNESIMDNVQKHKLAYGQAINEKCFAELYINTASLPNKDLMQMVLRLKQNTN